MGFPRQPGRALLPVLRGDRRQGRVRAQHGRRGAEGAGVGGVLTWVHRIARIQVRERDLFGRWASRWRVIRTSNAYVFRDPGPRVAGVPASKSGNRSETQNQRFLYLHPWRTQTARWSVRCGI